MIVQMPIKEIAQYYRVALTGHDSPIKDKKPAGQSDRLAFQLTGSIVELMLKCK